MSMNLVVIQGNLTDAPVLRDVPRSDGSSVKVGNFTVAVSRNFRRKGSQEWESETSFVDVEVWESAAERAAQSLSKGDPVLVQGSLKQDKWTTDDGQNRSKLKVRSDRFQKLARFQKQEGGEGEAANAAAGGGENIPF